MVKSFDFPLTNSPNRGFIAYLSIYNQLDKLQINATQTRGPVSNPTTYYEKEYAIDGDIGTRYCSISDVNNNQYFQINIL